MLNEKYFVKELNWAVAQNQLGKSDFLDNIRSFV